MTLKNLFAIVIVPIVFVVALWVAVPQPAFAQPLVPQECAADVTKCNFCAFLQLVKNVVDFIFEALAVIAVIMMVFAGLKLVTSAGNVNAMQQAKEMMTNVIIGFVIVLAAWLIVDTIVKGLSGGNQQWGMWNQFSGEDCGGTKSKPTDAGSEVEF